MLRLFQQGQCVRSPTLVDGKPRQRAPQRRFGGLVVECARAAGSVLVERPPARQVAELCVSPGEGTGRPRDVVLLADLLEQLDALV